MEDCEKERQELSVQRKIERCIKNSSIKILRF